jgi:3-hydroxyacyl-CoA dehydrogenase
LSPYSLEVTALVADGVPLDVIDKALKKFGMPVGPITLSGMSHFSPSRLCIDPIRFNLIYNHFKDEVGVDISAHVASFMSKADLGVRMTGGDASYMQKMLDKGLLGRKAGKGFYLYPKDAKKGLWRRSLK